MGEGIDDEHDLQDEQQAAQHLHQRAARADGGAEPARRARGDQDHETGKGPVADHGDEDWRIEAAEMFRDRILCREDQDGDEEGDIS